MTIVKILKYILLTIVLGTSSMAISKGQAYGCIYIAFISEQVMVLRQAGMIKSEVRGSLNGFPVNYPRNFEIYQPENLILSIVNDAYQSPVHKLKGDQEKEGYIFSDKWFEMCLSEDFKHKNILRFGK